MISYHDKDGKVVIDVTTPTTCTLKTINTRPKKLLFSKVRCELAFRTVKKKDIPVTVIPVDYFSMLAQTTSIIRRNINLTETFLGNPNWFPRMDTLVDFKALLIAHIITNGINGLSVQSGPCVLTKPSFDSAYAKFDTKRFVHLLKK